MDARKAYVNKKRNPVSKKEQENYRKEFKEELQDSILESSMAKNNKLPLDKRLPVSTLVTNAKKKTDSIAKELAALHEPDMVAGGWSNAKPSGVGRSNINSAIGGSWSKKRIEAMENAAKEAITKNKGSSKMNVKLNVARGG